jgi:phosphopantothenoylcysteine decarboxylase / phosphopantothenate---cysteine ligase
MKGKKILIGISGSIAAYKIPILVRLLIKQGAEVQVIMTPAAKDFVSPLVLGTLTKQKVHIDLFNEDTWSNHVMLGRWADLFLIAPASCNTLAKMANGLCDNFLLATYMSATCPIMIAPAMDEDMWHHGTTKQNMARLKGLGYTVLDAQHGELASGLIGMGRMLEPEELATEISNYLKRSQRLQNVKALVSAGPTYENIDPVRFIGNHSTGKMGIAIAEKLANEGAQVNLVLGPSALSITHPNIKLTRVQSAAQMYDACHTHFKESDITVMSAAVADYTPIAVANEKIKKKEDTFTIELTKTKDILKSLGAIKADNQLLVGFALESVDEKAYALKKLEAKNADMIVLNSVRDEGAGFGHDTNKVTIFLKDGSEKSFELKSKQEVAQDIVNQIIELKNK